MNPTYRLLRDALNELTEEQLDDTVSIYCAEDNEVIPVNDLFLMENLPVEHREHLEGVVEPDQPLLVINAPEGIDAETLPRAGR